MSFSLLDKLSGPLAEVQPTENGLCRHFKYGIRASVKIHAKGGRVLDYERPTAVFTNLLTTAGRLAISTTRDMEITDGINAKLIDDCGQLSSDHVFEALKSSGQVKGWVSFDIATNLTDRSSENFVGVIFNLLRMYYISQMKYEEYKLSPAGVFYNDGHVAITYGQHFDFRQERKPSYLINNLYYDIKSAHDAFNDGDFFPRAETMTDDEFAVLKTAVAGWTCDYPIRLFSSCPPLADMLVAANPNHLLAPPAEVELLNPAVVLSTLQKLIGENRVQSQFDLAYMLLTQAAFAPVPRAAEANAWVVSQYDLVLPRASSVRGASRVFTNGIPYQPRPAACVSWKKWTANRSRFSIHAAALTEAAFTGVFEVLTSGEGGIEGNLAEVGLAPSGPSARTRAFLEFASYRFGSSFKYCWDTACGLDLINPILKAMQAGAGKITIEKVGLTMDYDIVSEKIGEKEIDRLIAKELKPVMFPVLSYGVNDDRYYLNSMYYHTDVYLAPNGDGIVKGSNDASKFMAIMRLGGFDVALSDGHRIHKNWAANSNGHCMAIPPNELNLRRDYEFSKHSIKQRKMHWMDTAWMVRGHTTLSVEVRPYSYVLYHNGQQNVMDVKNYTPVAPDDKLIKESDVIGLTVATNDGKMPYRYSDFLFRQTLVEPETAESLLALSDIKQSQPIEVSPEQDSSAQAEYISPDIEM